jgi:secondary thiamine-phosphate synthase enzyme
MPTLEIRTDAREVLVDIGPQLREVIRASGVRSGVVHLWSLHTTCALTVNENADPDVKHDMVEKLRRMVPQDERFYRHAEGNSDSHLKTSFWPNGTGRERGGWRSRSWPGRAGNPFI